MSGLFGSTKIQQPDPPKVVRAPTEDDDSVIEAARQRRRNARARGGRRGTILTDALKTMTGSSGQRLGS